MESAGILSDTDRGIKKYILPIVFACISISLIINATLLLIKSTRTNEPIQFVRNGKLSIGDSNYASSSANSIESADINSLIFVDIEGAVNSPGVQSVTAGSRVEDVLRIAGGISQNADTEYVASKINRAMKVADGMKIYIPFRDDTSHNDECGPQGYDDVAQSCKTFTTSGKVSQDPLYVSVNMGSLDELDTLPGVGPVTAQKIIDNRPYETLEELVVKKAVGSSVFEKIKQLISL